MNIIKSIFLVMGLLTLTTLTTNAYFSDQVTILGNQFSTGTWENPNDTIEICHATGKENNYQSISPDKNGIINGHVGSSHQDGRDIIPPFDYVVGDQIQHFFGQNWDSTGQAIFNNDCESVSVLPTSSI